MRPCKLMKNNQQNNILALSKQTFIIREAIIREIQFLKNTE